VKLISTSTLRSRLGFASISDVDTAIGAALDGVTPTLEAFLRTKFATLQVTDTFFVNQSEWVKGQNRIRLLLTRGFVSTGFDVSIRYANLKEKLVTGGDFTSLTVADVAIIDYEKGVIDIVDTNLDGLYVDVTYQAGFDPDSGDATLFDLTATPDWLREAAALRATLDLSANPVLMREDQTPGEFQRVESAHASVTMSHVRYVPGAIKAINTEGARYSLNVSTPADVHVSGEALVDTGDGISWDSVYVPTNVPVVTWGALVLTKVASSPSANEYSLSGNTFTFWKDLGATAPVVWYLRAP